MTDFPDAAEFQPLIDLAVREDLGVGATRGDVTSELTVPDDLAGTGTLFQKRPGVACGLPIVAHVCRAFDARLSVEMPLGDREGRQAGEGLTPLARLRGPMRSILAAERTVLNFVQRLSGIATTTRAYVERVAGTGARILDTRKTLPGYRALDKYAVRAGGGQNHRVGLYDMMLVKDNHLATMTGVTPAAAGDDWATRLAEAVRRGKAARPGMPVEVEVVDEVQFARVLEMSGVDVVLLDNMTPERMRACVARRDAAGARGRVHLEASGGITLATVAAVAATGVERISVGALTHSVVGLDISLEVGPG